LAPDTPLPALISLLAKPQPKLRSVALAGFVNKPETDGPECLTPA
ncbi:MAG: SOS response-associated peptidase, partial [Pseudomonas aeruginosa]|nr:SOS response-associated peptidase [Pseudomonas aeruginosa]